jgi:tRNA (cmo5U34)-methyltransferase
MPPAEQPEQFHFAPDTYQELIRDDVPRYDELQRLTVEAVPFQPDRVLELGVGTGETTRRLLERFPAAEVTGLDSTPDMVFEARLARMEDPLPDGPWDLVISVLTIHHLDAASKQDLFRRVGEQSRALVFGDVVEVPPDRQVASLTEGFDIPSPAADQAEWCGGEIVWEADDLAIIRAVYD